VGQLPACNLCTPPTLRAEEGGGERGHVQREVHPLPRDDEARRQRDLAVQRRRLDVAERAAEEQPPPRGLRVGDAHLERDVLPRRDVDLKHQVRLLQAHCFIECVKRKREEET
jgi:hypothetical protein